MSYLSVDSAWQFHRDRQERLMAAARRRRLRPRPPVDRLPDPAGPDRAA